METYQVKPGDSLSKISQMKYGDFSMVGEIARLNNISNANLIMPGQTLRLPEVQEAQVTVLDQNGNEVPTKKNWVPLIIGGLLVAGGIAWVMNRNKGGKKKLNGPKVLLFKKTNISDLKEGMKVAYADVNGEFTKVGTIKSISNGIISLEEGGAYTTDELKLLSNKKETGLRGGVKKKLSKADAKKMAIAAGVDFSKDFHEQSKGTELAEIAKKAGYRKSKSAPGSTGRAFFEHLSKVK